MDIDWGHLFGFGVSPFELIVRGSAIYWFLFLLFRFVLRRDIGSIAIADVLLVVLIADASQNAMAGAYDSISEGFVLVATIAAWNYAFDWASYHSVPLRRLMEPDPLPLVRDGRMLRKNMRRELITVAELVARLHEAGLEHFEDVASATLETDGTITIIKREDPRRDEDTPRPPKKRQPVA